MSEEQQGPSPEEMGLEINLPKDELIGRIENRAAKASPKVAERVNLILDEIKGPDVKDSYARTTLNHWETDLPEIAYEFDDDPNRGKWQGWTEEEVKEVYQVLFGEPME